MKLFLITWLFCTALLSIKLTITKKFNDKGYASLLADLRGQGKSIHQNTKENKVVTVPKFSELKTILMQSDKKVGFTHLPQDLMDWLEFIGEDESLDMVLLMSMTKELFIAAKNDPLGAKERSL